MNPFKEGKTTAHLRAGILIFRRFPQKTKTIKKNVSKTTNTQEDVNGGGFSVKEFPGEHLAECRGPGIYLPLDLLMPDRP